MGFWSKLFGKKDAKLNLNAVDRDGDGKVQDGTIWERPAELTVPSIDEVEKQVDELLRDLFPVDPEAELAAKKAKRSAAAKKAAATRAAAKKTPAPAAKAPATKKPATKKK